MLAEHPHVFAKLREEIMDKLGPNKRPTFEDMKDMKYLRAVVNGSCPFVSLRLLHGNDEV
jgi:hypothetical protein